VIIPNISVIGGSITDIIDLAVRDGSIGASTAANSRTNLGPTLAANVTTCQSAWTFLAELQWNRLPKGRRSRQ
jgi:hypothetical protein